MRTITVKDFADAVRKNGYKQAFGAMFRDKNEHFIDHDTASRIDEIDFACAVGQARINLGWVDDRVWHDLLYDEDDEVRPDASLLSQIVNFTIGQNDRLRIPLNIIADKIEANFINDLVIAEVTE